MYLRALPFRPSPEDAYQLDSLFKFGPITGAMKVDFLTFREDPLAFGRLDITPMLKVLLASDAYLRLSWDGRFELHEWDTLTVIVVIFQYFRNNDCIPGDGAINAIWLKCRFNNDYSPQPTVVIELDSQFMRNLNKKERYSYMRDLVLRMKLDRLCSAFVEFHCGEWGSMWQCAARGSGYPDNKDGHSGRCRELFTGGELA